MTKKISCDPKNMVGGEQLDLLCEMEDPEEPVQRTGETGHEGSADDE